MTGHTAPDSSATLELIELARRGSVEAFNSLFDRHRGTLRGFIENRLDNRLRGRLDASDVVQETQIVAYRRFSDFCARRPMPFHLWLRKTAHERLCNLRRDHLSTQRRAIAREMQLPDRSSQLIAGSLRADQPTPSEVVASREYHERLTALVEELPLADREVLLMRNVEGLSHVEIAQLLEIDHATARKRYARALVRLEQLMIEQGLMETD